MSIVLCLACDKSKVLIDGYHCAKCLKKRQKSEEIISEDIIEWIKGEGIWKNIKKTKSNKSMEDNWGKKLTGKDTCQWTTILGEDLIAKKLLEKKYGDVWKPKKLNGLQPDFETKDYIFEIKTRNWTTSGTAGEKILGTPYKYIDIPTLYNKQLKILVIAYQEYEADNIMNLFNPKTERQKKVIAFWESLGISFVKCSSLI